METKSIEIFITEDDIEPFRKMLLDASTVEWQVETTDETQLIKVKFYTDEEEG